MENEDFLTKFRTHNHDQPKTYFMDFRVFFGL